MITCPYCLKPLKTKLTQQDNRTVYTCKDGCGNSIHRDYVEQPNIPRHTIGLVGFSGHGKTVCITSLFYLLKQLENEWAAPYILDPLDSNTRTIMYKKVPEFGKGILPTSTPSNFPKPALLYFDGIPSFGSRFLSFFDVAGAVYEDPARVLDQGRFVAAADVVIFVLNIKDFGSHWQDEMRALLAVYRDAVYNQLHINLQQRQHLIVVLSKADQIFDRLLNFERRLNGDDDVSFHDLSSFLERGSYKAWVGNDFSSIFQDLSLESKNIRVSLELSGCRGFILEAEQSFRSVEYITVSATGQAPNEQNEVPGFDHEHPKRVLDVFMWVLLKTQPQSFFRRLLKTTWSGDKKRIR